MTNEAPDSWRSTLRLRDLFATSLLGLLSRRARTALTAGGIAIGIASIVAVTGISASSRAALLADLDAFGTNVLEVKAAPTGLNPGPLPVDAATMLNRVATVTDSAAMIDIVFPVKRNEFDSELIGVDVLAVDGDLGRTVRASVATGRMIDDGTRSLPVAVLGAAAAERLGMTSLEGGPMVSIGGENFVIIGVLGPLPLNPDVDRAVLIGDQAAVERFRIDPYPSRILLRLEPGREEETRRVLPATASPGRPSQVAVSRPSDLVEARAQIDENLRNLLLGLGAVALLVGGLGIANIMVISVLERTGEIGLRRAIGAHRTHIAAQFVTEAATLSAFGGLVGIVVGSSITWIYARRQGWLVDIPLTALAAGLLVAIVIGVIAGLYPASKASRLDPAQAARGGN